MASPTLPFSEFLGALRDKGFGVGLHEYLALGRLLDAWGSFEAYPRLESPLSAATVVAIVAFAACALLPFADRRGIGR